MLDAAPDPQNPDLDLDLDPAVLRAESRLRALEELREIGMKLARSLEPVADEKSRDPAEVFGKLSRAIRLTIALEAKTDAELRDLRAGIVRAAEDEDRSGADAGEAAPRRVYASQQERIEVLVMEAAEAEIADEKTYDTLWEALEERLEEDPLYADCSIRPLRETVERLCRDLKLNPDWSRWDGDGWIDEGPTRPIFSPFNTPSAKPILKPSKRRLQ